MASELPEGMVGRMNEQMLEVLKAEMMARGYTLEEDEHGIRIFRPDGELCIVAKKKPQEETKHE